MKPLNLMMGLPLCKRKDLKKKRFREQERDFALACKHDCEKAKCRAQKYVC